jgi:hypothetical protein
MTVVTVVVVVTVGSGDSGVVTVARHDKIKCSQKEENLDVGSKKNGMRAAWNRNFVKGCSFV